MLMFSKMSKTEQKKLRKKLSKEHKDAIKEYGIEPQVTGPYALIKVVEPEQLTTGGIIIPVDDRDAEAMKVGMVIAFGPTSLAGYELPNKEVTRGPTDYGVAVGDFVEYHRHEGSLCSYGQFSDYRVLPAQKLYVVYKETK